MADVYSFSHDTSSSYIEYTGKSTVSVTIKALWDMQLQSVTFKGVKSSYISGGEVQDIQVTCNRSSDTVIVSGNYQDVIFSLDNYVLGAGNTLQITMRTSRTFELEKGIDSTVSDNVLGVAVLLGTMSNVPAFDMSYIVNGTPYLRTDNINGNYPYIEGLAVDHGDYPDEPDWWIDEDKVINAGYPFILGLAVDYGDHVVSGNVWIKMQNGFTAAEVYIKTNSGFVPAEVYIKTKNGFESI